MKRNIIIIAGLFILVLQSVHAQVKPKLTLKRAVPKTKPIVATAPTVKPQFTIYLRAAATNSGIRLRWATPSPAAWKLGCKYGYSIERYTINRDGKPLNSLEKLNLTPQPLKPHDLAGWETLAKQSDYAAVMAQALYGETFDMGIDGGDTGLVSKTINRVSEVQQRYGAFYFAADLDFAAACLGATGFVDSMAKPNEKYLYQVFCPGINGKAASDTALALLSGNEYFFTPKITESYALFGNKTVSLGWNHGQAERSYTAYHIEKSTDGGKSFSRITETPVSAFANSNGSQDNGLIIHYDDSLAANEVAYSYRIIGLTPFGEEVVCSDTLAGAGRDVLPYNPNISGVDFDKAGRVRIDWDFDKAGDSLISGFRLSYGGLNDSNYTVVKTDILPGERSVWYDIKQDAGYYAITAIPKHGESRRSFPYMIEPEDSIAPKSPAGLEGFVDSSGLVILNWKANNERDVYGYRIFKKLVAGHEFTALIDTFYRDTVFFDRVNMNQLNGTVYYTLKAYDKHYNPSPFSQTLALRKPDLIPPTQPVFADYKTDGSQVWLKWINSQDADVATHLLLRKKRSAFSARWDTLQTFSGHTIEQQYEDKNTEGGTDYLYTLLAKDSSGNVSPPAVPLTVKTGFPKLKVMFRFNAAVVNREKRLITLDWMPPQPAGISEIQLYRSEDKGPLSFYKTLKAATTSFIDDELKASSLYRYGLRAVLPDGRLSDFSIQEVAY